MAFKRSLLPAMLRSWWEAWEFPENIYDQHFGTILHEEDMYPPSLVHNCVVRERTKNAVSASGQSEVKNEADKFQIKLSVIHFKPEEIVLKIVNRYIVIHCEHEEVPDSSGFIAREFTRRYVLPEGTDVATITAILGVDGILVIEAPKSRSQKSPEHRIPVNIEKIASPELKSQLIRSSSVERTYVL